MENYPNLSKIIQILIEKYYLNLSKITFGTPSNLVFVSSEGIWVITIPLGETCGTRWTLNYSNITLKLEK